MVRTQTHKSASVGEREEERPTADRTHRREREDEPATRGRREFLQLWKGWEVHRR